MFIPTAEQLRAVEKRLLASGDLSYIDWPLYQTHSADGKVLSNEEIDAICTAVLLDEAINEPVVAEYKDDKIKDKSKGGRPKKGDNKLKCISTMVSPKRHSQLQSAAKEFGLTISEFVRPMVDPRGARMQQRRVGQIIKRGLSLVQRQKLRALTMMSADLDQMATAAETAGNATHASTLRTMAKEIREVVTSFSN